MKNKQGRVGTMTKLVINKLLLKVIYKKPKNTYKMMSRPLDSAPSNTQLNYYRKCLPLAARGKRKKKKKHNHQKTNTVWINHVFPNHFSSH